MFTRHGALSLCNPRPTSCCPQAAPRDGSAFPHLTSTASGAQRGRFLTQGHTAIWPSPGREATRNTCFRGDSLLRVPLGGGAGPARPALRPQGAARGAGGGSERSGEECEREGCACRERLGQLGWLPGQRLRQGRRRAMPHFTVVPADTWPDRAHVDADPTFLSLHRRLQCLAS